METKKPNSTYQDSAPNRKTENFDSGERRKCLNESVSSTGQTSKGYTLKQMDAATTPPKRK